MKRIRCPKCENYLTFDETQYSEGQSLVFVCDHCKKMSKRFEKVAAALQDDPSLTFLRYSVNENDIDVEQIYVGMEGADEG